MPRGPRLALGAGSEEGSLGSRRRAAWRTSTVDRDSTVAVPVRVNLDDHRLPRVPPAAAGQRPRPESPSPVAISSPSGPPLQDPQARPIRGNRGHDGVDVVIQGPGHAIRRDPAGPRRGSCSRRDRVRRGSAAWWQASAMMCSSRTATGRAHRPQPPQGRPPRRRAPGAPRPPRPRVARGDGSLPTAYQRAATRTARLRTSPARSAEHPGNSTSAESPPPSRSVRRRRDRDVDAHMRREDAERLRLSEPLVADERASTVVPSS